jgi:hypothetical protein
VFPYGYVAFGMETLKQGTLMSKGAGRVERAIAGVFEAEPDNAFTVEDLCDRAYPGELVEKKHRVAVLRAAKNPTRWQG